MSAKDEPADVAVAVVGHEERAILCARQILPILSTRTYLMMNDDDIYFLIFADFFAGYKCFCRQKN